MAKGGQFEWYLQEVQMLNLALMPPFCQTPVGRSLF
jgi:hypothetical protein